MSFVLIVHIVSGAAIRKCFLNRTVLSRPDGADRPNRSVVDDRHADAMSDGSGPRGARASPIRLADKDLVGGTAMRRPREVGIVMVMLLGLSGCAGMPQQGGWASPSGANSYASGANERPLARLAWWRRPKADSETPPGDASGVTNPGRTGLLASDSASSSDASTARPSLLRRFALLGQRLTGNRDDDSDSSLPPAWKHGSPAAGPVTTAYAAPASSRVASGSTSSASAKANSDQSSGSPGEVALDVSGKQPQLDSAAIPAGHSGTTASSAGDSEAAPPVPFVPDAYQQSPAAGRPAPGQPPIKI